MNKTNAMRLLDSAGVRGCQIIIDPEALRAFLGAQFCDVTK
jgi:prolyl-tRNA editing enzyme YbaK/EbsC (Cys-tRNA(Pro) deacylase)